MQAKSQGAGEVLLSADAPTDTPPIFTGRNPITLSGSAVTNSEEAEHPNNIREFSSKQPDILQPTPTGF